MNSNWSYRPETRNLGQNRRFLEPCDLEIWRMTRKRLRWVMTSVTLTFDLWPWPFAWTSLLSLVITHENFVMIRWSKHSQKGVTDRQTDWTIHRAAWSQLKIWNITPKLPSLGVRGILQWDVSKSSNDPCRHQSQMIANRPGNVEPHTSTIRPRDTGACAFHTRASLPTGAQVYILKHAQSCHHPICCFL